MSRSNEGKDTDLRREIARLKKENEKLADDIKSLKSHRECYELAVSIIGKEKDESRTVRTYYAKKRDAMNDLRLAWTTFVSAIDGNSEYKPVDVCKGIVQLNAINWAGEFLHATVTRLNLI